VKPTGVVTNENTDSATLSRSRMTVRDKTPVSRQRQVEPTLSTSNFSESESSLNLAAEDEDSHLELKKKSLAGFHIAIRARGDSEWW
jgi:hypothetical protein